MHDRGTRNTTAKLRQAVSAHSKMRARLSLLAVCATVSFALIGQLGVTVCRSLPSVASPHLCRPLWERHRMRSRGRDHTCAAAIRCIDPEPCLTCFVASVIGPPPAAGHICLGFGPAVAAPPSNLSADAFLRNFVIVSDVLRS